MKAFFLNNSGFKILSFIMSSEIAADHLSGTILKMVKH